MTTEKNKFIICVLTVLIGAYAIEQLSRFFDPRLDCALSGNNSIKLIFRLPAAANSASQNIFAFLIVAGYSLETVMAKRNETLDIIRIISLLCINGVHFFRNSGFYSVPVEGGKMLILCIFRSLFIICVPMFLMLSGYLMNQKTPSKKYFWGITKTIVIYFLCSVVFSLFLKFVQKEEMDPKIFITNLFSFEGTKYAWYIEMYLGLYLIIPFLNIIFNNLKDKK